jgi:hypothetical protein
MPTFFHSCRSKSSIWGIILRVYLRRVLVFNGITSVQRLCLNCSLDSSPPPIWRYTPNFHLSMSSPRTNMTSFGVFWNSLFRHLTPQYCSNNPAGIGVSTSWNLVGVTSSISASRQRSVYFINGDCTTIFLKSLASFKYADTVTTLQSNVDSYCHPEDEYFLPQHFCVTNIATLINNNAKAHVHDLAHCYVNRRDCGQQTPGPC